jgi:hypothetical protein
MTQAFNSGDRRRFSIGEIASGRWQSIAIASLGFWVSISLILDLVIMPTLWTAGMMESSGFAAASYSIFWIFNRIELVCAAIVLCSIRAAIEIGKSKIESQQELIAGAVALLAISLSYTFILSPQMGGLGVDLDILDPTKTIPIEMDRLHAIYWTLEASKLGIAGMLLSSLGRSR